MTNKEFKPSKTQKELWKAVMDGQKVFFARGNYQKFIKLPKEGMRKAKPIRYMLKKDVNPYKILKSKWLSYTFVAYVHNNIAIITEDGYNDYMWSGTLESELENLKILHKIKVFLILPNPIKIIELTRKEFDKNFIKHDIAIKISR